MKTRQTRLSLISGIPILAAIAALSAGGAHWRAIAQATSPNGPKNYGVIWGHELTRSGLPRTDQQWNWLRQQGVRSIVTFRPQEDIEYSKFGFEHVMRVPLSASVMPSEEQAQAYLKFIRDPANQPVHIHCDAGRDRTGMMAALARYSIDGWPLDKALEEARQYRDGKLLSLRRIAWLGAWAKEHPPGSFN